MEQVPKNTLSDIRLIPNQEPKKERVFEYEPNEECKGCKFCKDGTCDGLWFIGCTDYEVSK